MEFSLDKLQQLPMDEPQTGGRYKNLKEISVGNGVFSVDGDGNLSMRNSSDQVISTWTNEGKIEIRDSSGNVVILLDPTV